MKKILIIHYSQTGQLTDIVKSVTAPFKKNEAVSIIYEEIKPKPAFLSHGRLPGFAMSFLNLLRGYLVK